MSYFDHIQSLIASDNILCVRVKFIANKSFNDSLVSVADQNQSKNVQIYPVFFNAIM